MSVKRGKLPASQANSISFGDRNSRCGNYTLLSFLHFRGKYHKLRPLIMVRAATQALGSGAQDQATLAVNMYPAP